MGIKAKARTAAGGRKSLAQVALELAELGSEVKPGERLTPHSIRSLGIDASWQTILKAAKLMVSLQERLWERGLAVEVLRDGREWKIVFRRRFEGLSPEEVARRVRELYFPKPDEVDVLLVRLFNLGADSPDGAVRLLPGPALERALELGLVAESAGRYHLTELGVAAARSTLRMYPELKGGEC